MYIQCHEAVAVYTVLLYNVQCHHTVIVHTCSVTIQLQCTVSSNSDSVHNLTIAIQHTLTVSSSSDSVHVTTYEYGTQCTYYHYAV